jgi:23S rRNA maturation-related 3'-5' exoribonuclease YhaM
MNERIKELANQAKFMAEETINRKISANTELYAFAEKLAELIVKECALLADEAEPYKANDLILKHFGVEE